MRHPASPRRLVLLAVFAALVGCASGGRPAPGFESPQATQDAILYVMRTDSTPRQGNVDVIVDGKRVAALPDNRFTWVRVPAGYRDVVVAPADAFSYVGLEIRIHAQAGKSYLLQYLAREDGGPALVYGHGRRAVGVAPSSTGFQRLAVLPDQMIDRVVRDLRYAEPTL